jgi:signal peptide peptidase SppA
MSNLDHLLAWARTTPWAIRPDYGETIFSILARRAAGMRLSQDEIESRVAEKRAEFDARAAGAVKASRGGLAVVPVLGVISPRASAIEQSSGMTSPESIGAAFDAALADPNVSTILLDVNSPGGSVQGVTELASKIRASSKPVVAQVNYLAASAAYWLASQADEVIASPSAEVGSIGVYAMHEDVSAATDKAGVKVSLISAGKNKVESNPFAPLSEDARAHLQAQVDEMYSMFTADVAKGRGVPRSVAAGPKFGEGRTLLAKAALDAGMVDRVATFEETLSRFANGGRVSRRMRAEDAEPAIQADSEPTPETPRAGPHASHSDDADLLELEVLSRGNGAPSRAAQSQK